MTNRHNSTTFEDAFSKLAQGLETRQAIKVGSFWEFLRDIWSTSFDHPEYFQAWHVGVVAEDVERCVEEGLNYVAILPRFHFKSTLLGHAFSVWRLLKANRDCSVLYLSYSDHMARYHIAEINKTVNRNPQLKEWMVNRSPKADYSFRYYVNGNPMEISHGGLFSFKRGMHVNGALIADDILRDPDNPLNMGQLNKIDDHFLTESMYIPLKGVPTIVLGTPMLPGDLLTKLQSDERFFTRVLPALDPVPGRRVLMPELYSEEWLLKQQKARPKSFASEFLLVPHLSTQSYFEEEEIRKCEYPNLFNYSAYSKYADEDDSLFAGFDVGKKRHPSHLVIFRKRGSVLEQVHQSWLDGWNYSDQIDYLNQVAENFNIQRGYIDNTRGELEDRGLDSVWSPMSFTQKSKNTMAQVFEQYVHSDNLKLLTDERQRQQILCVNNELKAPEGPMGHGDAFFSIAMALQAAYESGLYNVQSLGNVMDWFSDFDPDTNNEQSDKQSAELQKKWGPGLTQGSGLKDKDVLRENKNSSAEQGPGDAVSRLFQIREEAPNKSCSESLCNPTYWVKERNLCLYCGHRG